MYNIAIDGPAGAGKSTIAKKAAKKLDFIYVDTGAMYRAIALYFIRAGVKAEDEKTISEKCVDIDVSIDYVILGQKTTSQLKAIPESYTGSGITAASVLHFVELPNDLDAF